VAQLHWSGTPVAESIILFSYTVMVVNGEITIVDIEYKSIFILILNNWLMLPSRCIHYLCTILVFRTGL